MRYDKTIRAVTEGKAVYDPDTGDYEEQANDVEVRVASVSNTGMETIEFLYGEPRADAKTVRLKTPIPPTTSYIVIDGDKYYVKLIKTYRQEQVIEVVKS